MQNLSLWSSGMCRKQNFEDTFCFLFIASYYVFFRWTFSRLYFGTLGGSLRIRWKERVWVVKQDFHASFQDNVTFFCCCFFFCHFLSTPWLNRAHYRQPSHNFGFQSSVQKNKHQGREDTRSVTKRQCSHDLFHMIFPCTNMFCTLSTHPF